MSFSWIVSQIGARQHYGVPRGFFYKGELRLLYTEAWCRWGSPILARGNARMRAFAGRYHPDLPSRIVKSFNPRTLFEIATGRTKTTTLEEEYLEYLRVGNWFSTEVTRDLKNRKLNPGTDVFFGFNTGCLQTLQFMRDRGIPTICDQIDPAAVEEQIVHEETLKWPGWQRSKGRIPQAYWDHMHQEWDAASMILVNSQWAKDALIKQGVPEKKMFIVPVAYEPARTHLRTRANFDGPLKVLWIGTVNLRKGIQYLIQAAKRLVDNPRIRIIVAGPVQISDEAVASAPKNMEFIGRVTRDRAEAMYREADVFVLPTISDGFAITQVEAMSQAMPVIATTSCGEVVTDGLDGFVIPPADEKALADAITKLDSDRKLLREMSYRALDKSSHFYLPRQAQLVEEAVVNFRAGRPWDVSKYKI